MAPVKSKVFVVYSSLAYLEMFRKAGWEVTSKLKEADLVQFTGGADVSPELYGQAKHSTTTVALSRDFRERIIFNLAKKLGKPMAGICRGGQFLNVMCGGSLFQDVDGHFGSHNITDISTGIEYPVSSDHHQMMSVGEKGTLLAYADQSTFRDICFVEKKTKTLRTDHCDPEVVWYEQDKCLCFQYHPEYSGYEYLADMYFGYLRTYLYLSCNKKEITVVEEKKPAPSEIEKSLTAVRKSLEAQQPPLMLSPSERASLSTMDYPERLARMADIQAAFENAEIEGVQVH